MARTLTSLLTSLKSDETGWAVWQLRVSAQSSMVPDSVGIGAGPVVLRVLQP